MLNFIDPELQMTVSPLTWVLGIKLQFFCKSSKQFKALSFSPALEYSFVHLGVRCVGNAQDST